MCPIRVWHVFKERFQRKILNGVPWPLNKIEILSRCRKGFTATGGVSVPRLLFFQKIRAGEVPGADPSWDNRGEALRRNHALFNALPDREKMKLAREAQSLTAPYSVAHKASDTAALANKLNSLRKKENQCTLEGMP